MDKRIALVGNPNCGKTTLFNALTGSNQFVGNWPGVTVEKKEGRWKGAENVIVTDLPGIYSLSPYSPEEVVARNYLVNERPDVILNLVDGTNLERNLYLTTQLLELGIPVVVAVNMMDVVRKNGDEIDTGALSAALGCDVVEISALKSDGLAEAVKLALLAAEAKKLPPYHYFSGAVEHAIAHIEEATVHHLPEERQRWYAVKIFERDEQVLSDLALSADKLAHVEQDIVAAEQEMDDDAQAVVINERYNYIEKVAKKCYKRKHKKKGSVTERIDRVVTNRFAALPIFGLVMFLIYYVSVHTVGAWAVEWTADGVTALFEGLFLRIGGVAPWLQSLVIDGIVGGVGAVLSFVPQIFMLFLFLSFLEACGYMSRIAFILDRIFRKFGLSGKSFIPMLVGTGCSVPGIMASRTIENDKDRRMTVMTTSFVPCGAKLPIIAMIAETLFDGGFWVAPVAYFIGVAAVLLTGAMLKKTKLFASDPTPFVMELPAYHMPTAKNLFRATWERGWSFVKKAGTIILASTVAIWFFSNIGTGAQGGLVFYSEQMTKSLLDYIGGAIAWVFAPLGFGDPTAAVATLMGLLAKEEVVAVFGVTDFAGMTRLAAFSFLVFNLLCAPCVAAMGAIRREMGSAKWTWFAIGYQTLLAYAASLCIYQLGALFAPDIKASVLGIVVALLVIAAVLYLLLRRGYVDKSKGALPCKKEGD